MTVRLAVVGCGGMANAHVGRFDRVAGRVRVVAAVDPVAERAQAVAALFPGARWCTDHREVLDDCDAALLVIPHHLHHPVGMDFLRAGRHVLLEKPLANSESQCLELIDAARQRGRTLMVGYVMRYHPVVLKLKELLDRRALGDLFHLSIWTEQLTRHEEGHWARSAATLGGGQLFSHGCHYIDLLLWMLGRPRTGTHLGTNLGTPWMEREGTSNVAIRFESGALGYHFGTWGARGTRLGYAFHAHCTEGMLEADIRRGTVSTIVAGKVSEVLASEAEDAHMRKPTENEMLHFVDCIESGRRPLTDGPSSLQGLRLIWRLYEAEQRMAVADLGGLGLDQVDEQGRMLAG